MFKRWFCLALALVICWASLSSAEEIAIDADLAGMNASEGGLVIDELPGEPEMPLIADLELGLPGFDESGLPDEGWLDGMEPEDGDGLEVTETFNDVDQGEAVLTLSAKKLVIGIGEKCSVLKATRSPEDASDTVTWSSSQTSVVKVNKKSGRITGIKKGKATIIARTASGLKASCVVTVRKAPGSVSITPAELTLSVGESYTVAGKLPSGTGSTLTYTSGKKKIAKVDKKTGVVTAVAPGKTTITVKTFNGQKATCDLTVAAAPAEVFLPETLTVFLKEKTSITATAVDGNGNEVPATFTYRKKNDTGRIAINSKSGIIKGVAEGTAFVYVTTHNGVSTHLSDGASVETACLVNVVKAPSRIELSANEITIAIDETFDLDPRLLAEDGTQIQGVGYTVSCNDESVMSVSENGVVTGLKAGSGTVVVTAPNGVQASCSVTVGEEMENKVNYRLFAVYSYYDSLPFVRRNSESVANVFSKSSIGGQAYDTEVLGNASKSKILSRISSFFGDTDDNDVSIVYLCSHGHNNKSSYTSYKLSLMGYDSHKSDSRYYLTSREIFDSIQAIKGNVVLILDSCYSGTFINDMKGKLNAENGRIAVLTAASNTRATYYKSKTKSVDFFTFFLLQGLGYNEKESWWTESSDGDEGSYPGYFSADNSGDGAATLGEFFNFASNCIAVNIPKYMKKSWYWGDTSKVQKPRIYAGNLNELVIYKPE